MVAIGLGREAILAGYAVQFVTAMKLVAALAKAHTERRLEERLTNLAKPRLLIVDELGYATAASVWSGASDSPGNRIASTG